MAYNADEKIDIVVGIPSYNEADTIGFVAERVSEGLSEYFPDRKSIIVNVDNNSADNTREAFLNTKTVVEKKYITTGGDVRGKGHNLLNLFNYAVSINADMVIVVDADLRSITKEWIRLLAIPICDGHDFVTPLYSRHQFDGSITNHICYPVMFGMLSTDVRQPIGGDFALSSRLVRYLLKRKWSKSVKQYGIDIFLTMNAVFGDFKLCQTSLGRKIHNASAPKLGPMFVQVISTLLNMLVDHKDYWMSNGINKIRKPKIYGDEKLPEPQELDIDMHYLKEQCNKSYKKELPVISELLGPYATSRINNMFKMDYYNINVLLWTQIFYNLLFQYDNADGAAEKKRIIAALKPLYFARSMSFNYTTWKYNIQYAEMDIRDQALGFATQRYYLWGLYSCRSDINRF